jgi:hypothetical protein
MYEQIEHPMTEHAHHDSSSFLTLQLCHQTAMTMILAFTRWSHYQQLDFRTARTTAYLTRPPTGIEKTSHEGPQQSAYTFGDRKNEAEAGEKKERRRTHE